MAEELINMLQKYENNGLNRVIKKINGSKRLGKTDIDIIGSTVENSGELDIDLIILVNKYNEKYLSFPKNSEIIEDNKPVKTSKKVDWADVLVYLGIEIKDLDENTLSLMEGVTNFNSIVETAKFIKNSRRPENRIINKITDPNIVIMLLLFSNKKIISSVISHFTLNGKVDARCLGVAVEAIPSIFMNDPNNVYSNYKLFIDNFKKLQDAGIDVRSIIINKPILMISTKVEELLNSLGEDKDFKKTVVINAGHILITKPQLFSKNQSLLFQFGIDVNSCEKGKGFQVYGYNFLEDKLAIIKEMSYDDEVLSKPDKALESIRAFYISKNYNESKNRGSQYKRGAA